ncbi:MAG: hypothetical protein JWN48_314 [Myxococcaceae bacterium]|nr:hypothetical protein [Myxococcaceae bacterium]
MGFLSSRGFVCWLVLALTGCRHGAGVGKPKLGQRAGGASSSAAPLRSCGALQPLPIGRPTRASTASGDDRLRASCVRGAAPECVFEVVVDARSELRVALETGDFDGSLSLYEQWKGGRALQELRCVDDVPSGDVHHSRLDMTLGPGRYLLAVDGANHESGEFELFAELEPLPSVVDACEQARPLPVGPALRGSTRGGTNLFSATCSGGAQGPEHVHSIQLDAPARIRVRQQAEYDGSLYLRAQCEDASSELVCNDDFQSNARSMIAARLPAGTYYVYSDSYSREQSGDYALTLERFDEPKPTPSDALCAELARAPIKAGQRELDTLYGSFAFAGSCGGKATPEIALGLRVDAPTTLIAQLEDAELNAVMYLRRVCSDAASELACYVAPRIDRPPSESEMSSPALVVPLERGLYTLVIDGYEASDIGAATLRLQFTP